MRLKKFKNLCSCSWEYVTWFLMLHVVVTFWFRTVLSSFTLFQRELTVQCNGRLYFRLFITHGLQSRPSTPTVWLTWLCQYILASAWYHFHASCSCRVSKRFCQIFFCFLLSKDYKNCLSGLTGNKLLTKNCLNSFWIGKLLQFYWNILYLFDDAWANRDQAQPTSLR